MSSPHLLLLAVGFPPAAKSSTFRLREIANQFAVLGWRVTAVNAAGAMWKQDSGIDLSLLDGVHPGVDRIELPLERPELDTDIRTFSRDRALDPAAWRLQHYRKSWEAFPERTFGHWRPQLIKAAQEIHRRDPVDLVIASCTPYVLLSVADHMHRRHGVPYGVDFRDGWSIDVVKGEVAFDGGSRRGRIERRVLGDASALWVVNEPIAEHYRRRYPEMADRVHVVRNGFDRDSQPPPSGPSTVPLRFGYLGTINFSAARMSTVLDAWRLARTWEPLLRDAVFEVRGHVSAGASRETTEIAQMLAEAQVDGVVFDGPVPKSEVAATYGRWDALVLILVGGSYVTSGKVYEYAASGLPVVAAHEVAHDATRVLDGYPLGVGEPTLDPQELARRFCRAAHLAVEADMEMRTAARVFAAPLERPQQMEAAVRSLAASATSGTAAQ